MIRKFAYIAALAISLHNICAHESSEHGQHISTQTWSYLAYHKTHHKLGKYFLFLQAVQAEQQYAHTHVPLYIPLDQKTFAKYDKAAYKYQAQNISLTYALNDILGKEWPITAYATFQHAYQKAKRQSGPRVFSKWDKDVILQLFVPIEHVDTVAQFVNRPYTIRQVYEAACNGDTSVLDNMRFNKHSTKHLPKIQVDPQFMMNCSENTMISPLVPMCTHACTCKRIHKNSENITTSPSASTCIHDGVTLGEVLAPFSIATATCGLMWWILSCADESQLGHISHADLISEALSNKQ